MHWKLKARIYGLLSHLPHRQRWAYGLQRYVSRSLPISDTHFLELKALCAVEHFRNLRQVFPEPAKIHTYEFGAGWDLGIPLLMASLGVGKQTVVDIQPLAKLSLVNHSLHQISQHLPQLREQYKLDFQPLPDKIDSLDALAKPPFHIHYHAPWDFSNPYPPIDLVDFCHHTSTLEHIPPKEMLPLLRQTFNLLKPEGYMSATVDLQDHYSYADPSIGPHHFLRYSDEEWQKYNPGLHFQNRLRNSDYRRIFKEAGFHSIQWEPTYPTGKQREGLRGIPLAERFQSTYLTDLGITSIQCLLQKPAPLESEG